MRKLLLLLIFLMCTNVFAKVKTKLPVADKTSLAIASNANTPLHNTTGSAKAKAGSIGLFAPDLYDFENIGNNGTTFTSGAKAFKLTNNFKGQVVTQYGSGSPASNGYADTGFQTTRSGNVGGVQTVNGETFRLVSLDVWPSANQGGDVLAYGASIQIIGKKGGNQVATGTYTSATFNQTPIALGGAWHRVTITGALATTDIDQFEIVLQGTQNYMAIDQFAYSNLGAPAGVLLSTSPTLTFNSTTGFVNNIAEDGQGGSTAISDINIQTYAINSSAVKLTASPLEYHDGSQNGWTGYPAIITYGTGAFYGWSIKSSDASNFSLQSLNFLDWGNQDGQTFKIEAFDNGASKGSLSFVANVGNSNLVALSQTSGNSNYLLPASFGNVDEVRFYQANGNNSYIAFNGIKVGTAIVASVPVITGNPPNRTVCVNSNTNFSVTATNATAYQWQVNTGSGFNNITNGAPYSGATTATLTITGATATMNGYTYRCVASGGGSATSNAATLTVPNITVATTTQTNVSSIGGSNGSATIAPTGGISPYTYSWAPSGGTAATATGLAAGTYTITVTDNIGCQKTHTVTITQPVVALNGTTSTTSTSCFGGANGTATVTASGGTPGYTYSWAPSGGTAATATGLVAGTYSVTITDANSSQKTITGIVVGQPQALNGTVSTTSTSCFGGANGTATVTPSGGTSGYTYSWAPSGGTAATATGLVAGTYSVTITDANSCTKTINNIVVGQPVAALNGTISTTSTSCFGGANGTATVTPSGGTPGYTYLWSTGATTPTITGLVAGTYSVTITDANSCTKTINNIVVGQPVAALNGTTSTTSTSCFGGANGTATVTASGGTPGYTYSWAPSGGTAATATGLVAGTYSVTITDANNCQKIITGIVVGQPVAALNGTVSTTPTSCFGGANGTATVTPSGGTPGYTYLWSTGATTPTITGLIAGTYSVTITDANSCTKTINNIVVGQPLAILDGTATTTPVSCFGGANGTATVTPTGGTPGYSYAWAPSGGTAATATGLAAGTYSVTITDNNGCTKTITGIVVGQPLAVLDGTIAKTNVSCFGGANGTATVTPTGGTAGYTYLWSNGATTATITGLAVGPYSVTITDANSCTKTINNIIIVQPSVLNGTISTTSTSCFGGANGTATVTPSGGTPGYTYLWSTGATTPTITGLVAGTYNVTITDANSCTKTINNIVVGQPAAALNGTTSTTSTSCFGGANGTATVTASGGTPGYTYSWAPSGGTAATATGLAAGTYSVTITDANNCQKIITGIVVGQPLTALNGTATTTPVSCFGGANGTATVTATGGTSGYTYSWAPSGGTAATATGLAAGTYSVTITDNNGCTKTVSGIVVGQPLAVLDGTIAKTDVSCFGGANGTATVTPTGGTTGYTYLWSTGATTATISGLVAGTYSVTITDANACTKTINNITIAQPNAIVATASAQTDVSCNGGSNGSATVSVSGGTGPYTYSWSPSGGTAATATGLVAGTYVVTIKDANLCQTTQSFTISQPAAPTITTSSLSQAQVAVPYTASISSTGGTGTYSYAVTVGSLPAGLSLSTSGNLSGTPTASGTFNFTVTVTEAGCSLTATKAFTITSITSPQTITFAALPTQTFGNAPLTLTATSTSGLSVVYASNNASVATINGNTLTIIGAGTADITASQAGGSGYDPAADRVQTLTVNKANTTMTLSNLSQTFDGTPKSAIATTNPIGLTGVNITYNGLSTIPTAVGTYTVSATLTNTNYTAPPVTGSLVIAPKTINVTADAQSKTYGTSDPIFTYTVPAGSLITGDSFTGALGRIGGETIGTYAITTGTLTAGSNYDINLISANLTITAKGITGNFTAGNKVYDGNTNTNVLSRTLTGVTTADAADVFLTGGTATFADANKGTGKTVTPAGMTLGGTKAANYTLSSVNTTTADISSKNIDGGFTAENKVYDGNTTANILTRTLTGVLTADLPNVTLTNGTATFADENVGTGKTVTATGMTLTGTGAANYSLSTVVATTANISVKPITVTADAKTKTYGKVDPALVYTFSPALIGTDTFSGSLGRASGENVGTYAINQNTLALSSNYVLNFSSAALTITKAALNIIAEHKEKFAGTVNPVLTVAYDGFVNGETETVLNTPVSINTTATTNSPIGTYDIVPSGATASNYEINFVTGTLTINAGKPTAVTLTRVPIYENRPSGIAAGTLSSTSPDPTTTFTYTLVQGAGDSDNASFSISGNNLFTAASFNFEQKASYSIRVKSTTQYGFSLEQILNISISDVNEIPTIAAISNQTICYTNTALTIPLSGISAGPETSQTTTITVSSNNSALFQSLTALKTGSDGSINYTLRNGATGTATITVTIKDNGGTDNGGVDTYSTTFTITVNPLPVLTITADKGTQTPTGTISVRKGETLNLIATGGVTYVWTAHNSIISGQNTSTLTIRPVVTTTYTVTATNATGCSDTKSITITVNEDVVVPALATNIMSPNGDGVNDKWIVENLDLYPNNEVKVFDRAGRIIYSKKKYDNSWDATLRGLPLSEGTYYYIIDYGDGKPVKKGYITILKKK